MQLIATCILEAGTIAPCCAADSEGLIIGLERMRLQWARVDAIDPKPTIVLIFAYRHYG
jgi:hypothetical protein